MKPLWLVMLWVGVIAPAVAASGTCDIDLGGGEKLVFVHVPGGTFSMGSLATEEHRLDDEGPQHQVTISGFQMQTTEVTESQYLAVMGENPSYFRHPASQNQPVESVAWWDAIRFCNRLSELQGLPACYRNASNSTTIDDSDQITCDWTSPGFRLPTEAEWEYACRAGGETVFFWGALPDERYLIFKGNSQVSYEVQYRPEDVKRVNFAGYGPGNVGTKMPNGFGLYDMSGNVWEWCWDWYGPYVSEPQVDPRGPGSGVSRVFRGGCFFSPMSVCRPAIRNGPGCTVSGGWYAMGFRLARSGP